MVGYRIVPRNGEPYVWYCSECNRADPDTGGSVFDLITTIPEPARLNPHVIAPILFSLFGTGELWDKLNGGQRVRYIQASQTVLDSLNITQKPGGFHDP